MGVLKMESEEEKRKAMDARRESGRQSGTAMGKLLFAIGIALLLLGLVWLEFLRPLGVVCLCLGTTFYITSKHEEWFYPKRKDKS
jgi:hypothetical protein